MDQFSSILNLAWKNGWSGLKKCHSLRFCSNVTCGCAWKSDRLPRSIPTFLYFPLQKQQHQTLIIFPCAVKRQNNVIIDSWYFFQCVHLVCSFNEVQWLDKSSEEKRIIYNYRYTHAPTYLGCRQLLNRGWSVTSLGEVKTVFSCTLGIQFTENIHGSCKQTAV